MFEDLSVTQPYKTGRYSVGYAKNFQMEEYGAPDPVTGRYKIFAKDCLTVIDEQEGRKIDIDFRQDTKQLVCVYRYEDSYKSSSQCVSFKHMHTDKGLSAYTSQQCKDGSGDFHVVEYDAEGCVTKDFYHSTTDWSLSDAENRAKAQGKEYYEFIDEQSLMTLYKQAISHATSIPPETRREILMYLNANLAVDDCDGLYPSVRSRFPV